MESRRGTHGVRGEWTGRDVYQQEGDRVWGTRELPGSRFTEKAGVGVLRRHKAGFEAEIQGSRKQDMCDAFDRSNAIYPVNTSLEKTTV